jgi:hypothetical protein
MVDLSKYDIDILLQNTLKGGDHLIWKGDQTLDSLPVFRLFYALYHNKSFEEVPDIYQNCSRLFCVTKDHLTIKGPPTRIPDMKNRRFIYKKYDEEDKRNH